MLGNMLAWQACQAIFHWKHGCCFCSCFASAIVSPCLLVSVGSSKSHQFPQVQHCLETGVSIPFPQSCAVWSCIARCACWRMHHPHVALLGDCVTGAQPHGECSPTARVVHCGVCILHDIFCSCTLKHSLFGFAAIVAEKSPFATTRMKTETALRSVAASAMPTQLVLCHCRTDPIVLMGVECLQ